MKGRFYGAEVDIHAYFERRNGWMKDINVSSSSYSADWAKFLSEVVKREVKVLLPFENLEEEYKGSLGILAPSETVQGRIDHIEIKIHYKED